MRDSPHVAVDPFMPKVSSQPLPGDAAAVPDSPPSGAAIPFEQALEELETIVRHMEDGTLSLDQSLASYRRGAELVKVCETALEHVKDQVRVLDGEMLRPLTDLPSRGSDRS